MRVPYFLLSLAAPAIAQLPPNWLFIRATQSGEQLFLDQTSVVRQGSIVQYSDLNLYLQPTSEGIKAQVVDYTGDCDRSILRMDTGTQINTSGQAMPSVVLNSPFFKFDSTMQPEFSVLQQACQIAPRSSYPK